MPRNSILGEGLFVLDVNTSGKQKQARRNEQERNSVQPKTASYSDIGKHQRLVLDVLPSVSLSNGATETPKKAIQAAAAAAAACVMDY